MHHHSTPSGNPALFLSAHPALDNGLDVATSAPWSMNVASGELRVSAQKVDSLAAFFSPLHRVTDLLNHFRKADRYLFLQAFNADPLDQDYDRLRSCDVRLFGISGEPLVRFVGRLRQPDSEAPDAKEQGRFFEGVIVAAQHWLAKPSDEYALQFLSSLFADSPIPSFITDKQGVIVNINESCERLFHLSHRQAEQAAGFYSILRDKQLNSDPELAAAVQAVYHQGKPQTLEMSYSLGNIHRSRFICDKQIHFRVSFVPIPDRQGKVAQVLVQLQDLSREKSARDALQESEASYKAFITNSSEAIWCYDMQPPVAIDTEYEQQVKQIAHNARLVEANKVLVNMLGVDSLDDILGTGLIDSGSTNYVFDIHFFVKNNYVMVDHDIIRQDARGKSFYFQICCTGIVERGQLKRVWGTTKDITARRRYEEKLRYQSYHDSLTALPNREKLYADMQACFEQRSAEQISALLLIDLDRFKEINDTLGHNVGDHLLQLIGPRLANEMAEIPGTVARLGGDEFAVFLPRIRSTHQAVVFGHRLLDALSQEFDLEGFTAQISASIGIAISPQQAQDQHTLMRYADIAMYYAKSQMLGLAIYSAEYDPHSTKRLSIISELGRAIRENQLCLYYQPKILLDEKRCYGFEALIRWIHPELGFVPPADFIPMAELTTLIHQLTAWVLEKAISQCRTWQDQGMSLSIAVNLSARNLMDDNIPKLVERLLIKYQLPAARLELEITESSIMTDPTRALRNLDALHALGVHLAIDDFGTGYSSLAYLKRLPVQTLKIDSSFVRSMLEDLQDELIVNSTIHLAHNLGLMVVAEGVENEALLNRLSEMGCDEAQGFFIGKPMSVINTNEWLVESGWVKQPQ
ncbi:bifunctional diguanylate cyclase/phosphodiesterase [Cellvibrio sp. KY-YJ-3]|uniref:sensor domain-containing protein n=1 Tax=Cellvibrio sp. KY-YJ-3 TaxID=454662 RepID=UPI001244C048|nr:bifunctional diguanylate cyclase/phosphodiesterase [Cellvibrio sp. KY-YJ-3]QEY12538.1 bifunctional diguanylate cyclase/phosphodiesterase [Cellvibrio sp. KY-YJ-3]